MSNSDPKRDVDKGWAWFVLFASYFNLLMCAGLAYVAGMFQLVFLEHFQGSVAFTSWITALFSSFMQLAGPLSSLVCNVFSCRTAVILGGALMTVGLLVSSLIDSLEMLFVTFGFMAGCGIGLSYTASIVVLNFFFVERRTLVTGIALSASGLGILISPQISRLLFDALSWRETLVVLSGASAQICVTGALMNSVHEVKRRVHHDRGKGQRGIITRVFSSCRKDREERDVRSHATINYCGVESMNTSSINSVRHETVSDKTKEYDVNFELSVCAGCSSPDKCDMYFDGDKRVAYEPHHNESKEGIKLDDDEDEHDADYYRYSECINGKDCILRKLHENQCRRKDCSTGSNHEKNIATYSQLPPPNHSSLSNKSTMISRSECELPSLELNIQGARSVPNLSKNTGLGTRYRGIRVLRQKYRNSKPTVLGIVDTIDYNDDISDMKVVSRNASLFGLVPSMSSLEIVFPSSSLRHNDSHRNTSSISLQSPNSSKVVNNILEGDDCTILLSESILSEGTSMAEVKSGKSSNLKGRHDNRDSKPTFSEEETSPATKTEKSGNLKATNTSNSLSKSSVKITTTTTTKTTSKSGLSDNLVINHGDNDNIESCNKETLVKDCREFPPLYRNKYFFVLCVSLFVENAGCGVFNIHFPSFVRENGLSDRELTNLLSVNGFAILFGRCLCGALANSVKGSDLVIWWALHILGGLCVLTMPSVGYSYTWLVILTYGMGSYYGTVYAVLSSLTIELVGLNGLATAFGIEMVCAGMGYFLSPPLAGIVIDVTHDYNFSLYLAGSLYITGGMIIFILPLIGYQSKAPCKLNDDV